MVIFLGSELGQRSGDLLIDNGDHRLVESAPGVAVP
jgi:hypothetical protein